jgi:hypothetical protein
VKIKVAPETDLYIHTRIVESGVENPTIHTHIVQFLPRGSNSMKQSYHSETNSRSARQGILRLLCTSKQSSRSLIVSYHGMYTVILNQK